MKNYNSPILQDKYRWQEREYEKTKSMSTKEYAKYVEQRTDRAIEKAGYKKKMISKHAFRLS